MSRTKDRVMELMEADDSFDGEGWLGKIILIQHQGKRHEPHIKKPRGQAQARMDAIYIDDTPMEMGRKIEDKLKEKNT